MRIAVLVTVLAAVPGATVLPTTTLDVMPLPARVAAGEGRLVVDERFRVALSGSVDPRLERAAARFLGRLAGETGIPLPSDVGRDAAGAALEIRCDGPGERVQSPGENESYRLEIRAARAVLRAPTTVGALRGMETFLQLVGPGKGGFEVPVLELDDQPRFPWRGLLVDACRHWQPPEVIRRTLDAMAAVKLNVLHWHLSDDQGFRVESTKYPRLHTMGSDGDFYTEPQVREILEYARDRGIRVVPEFDIPGHTTAWFPGHPELASAPGPYRIERGIGIFDPCLDPTREEVYAFLDAFFGEMAALFPDRYFHIGGDEVSGKQWDGNPRIQAFKRDRRMKDNHALQAYFSERVIALVGKHGKTTVGWDEILDPKLPKESVVHSWRGQESLAQAARGGWPCILSFGYYLDHMQPASFHYRVDPLDKQAASLGPEERQRVLGGEACMWAEFVTAENVDTRIWPRTAAVAERLWSPAEVRDVVDMYRRLEIVSRRLERLDLQHRTARRRMLERLAGSHPVAPLETLSSVLEPVKMYRRSSSRTYTSRTPLNRLVDATAPESDTARRFGVLVDRLLAGGAGATPDGAELRDLLSEWRRNHERLEPMLGSAILEEARPLSRDLSDLAAAGLEALDLVSARKPPPTDWAAERKALLERAAKPRAECDLAIVPAIKRLIEAAARQSPR